jgi:hypothetical protein
LTADATCAPLRETALLPLTEGALVKIDIAAIDRSQFAVVEEADEVLVVARRGKYSYTDAERPLRALLLDRAGTVLSAGFAKFDNYGEQPERDRWFDEAFAAGAVTLREKLDGSLLIVDRIGGAIRVRTRGRRELGPERAGFGAVLREQHPALLARLAEEPALEQHSLLFELVLAERPVVLRYERSTLTLLAMVHKATVTVRDDLEAERALAQRLGVALAPDVALDAGTTAALQVRRWKSREGLVARFRAPDGAVVMLKLKSEDFMRPHGLRSRLNEPRLKQLACMLDLREDGDFLRALAPYGLDWEAAEMARPILAPWLAKKRARHARFDALKDALAPHLGQRDARDKAGYVARLRALIAADPSLSEPFWFFAGVEHFVRPHLARLVIDAYVFDEPLARVQRWAAEPAPFVRALIEAPDARADSANSAAD